MSSLLGVGSPLGWLCTIITDAALFLIASLKTSLTSTTDEASPPIEIIGIDKI